MKTYFAIFLSLFGITASWGAEASPPRQLALLEEMEDEEQRARCRHRCTIM